MAGKKKASYNTLLASGQIEKSNWTEEISVLVFKNVQLYWKYVLTLGNEAKPASRYVFSVQSWLTHLLIHHLFPPHPSSILGMFQLSGKTIKYKIS